MESPPDETPPLLIRCPSCGQRFKVGADLRERTVECGGCEQRFRITDEVILRSRKFYPGEHPQLSLNRYQRVPIVASVPEGLQTISYTDHADASSFEPVAPLRMIAGAAAVSGVVVLALMLLLGSTRGGVLDGMTTASRLMMAGFGSVLATLLLIYANPRSRKTALLFSLLCSGVLLPLPLVFTDGAADATAHAKAVANNEPAPHGRAAGNAPDRVSQLRQLIGTDPLVSQNARLAREGGGRHAYGLWLRGLDESNKLLVRDYLLRAADAEPASHPYPRGRNDYLMVVTGVSMPIEKLAELAAPLGELSQIYREIDVIEIRVNNGNFLAGPMDKLADKDDPAFYELNKRELECIDLERVQAAVKRLADAPPKMYRNDISRRLIVLLRDEGVEFKEDLCRALMRWADESTTAAEAAEAALRKLVAAKKTVPREMIALLVKAKRVSIIPILNNLWLADSGTWEPYYVELGTPIEASLIGQFKDLSGGLRNSAVHMLGKVGGSASLPVLNAVRAGADPELLVRIETAEKAIRERRSE
ncbi:MAG: hypothetical protein DVB25_00525 [Verrucomicrobia bacterium]|nr:MAG: hypothetical protein DVB25_00525 [Verrucomicrobiota bacterium]